MSTKLTKESVKTPDQVTQTLKKGFVWTTGHSKIVLAGLGVFMFLGAVVTGLNSLSDTKERTQQEKYYILEKNYLDIKRGFEEFQQAEILKNNPKNPKISPESDKLKKPSGDFDKDYGSVVAGFENFIKEYPNGYAAQMAALNLGEIYSSHSKFDEALTALQKVEKGLEKKAMTSALIWMQMGNLLANKKDCKSAIEKWQFLLNSEALAFAHGEAKLRIGLCYESMNEVAKAEEIFTEISSNVDGKVGNPEVAREAKKYLRILKAQKNL